MIDLRTLEGIFTFLNLVSLFKLSTHKAVGAQLAQGLYSVASTLYRKKNCILKKNEKRWILKSLKKGMNHTAFPLDSPFFIKLPKSTTANSLKTRLLKI